MRDAKRRRFARYDLTGANERDLVNYKAKFAPDLTTYYVCSRASFPVGVLEDLYRRFDGVDSLLGT